MAHIIGRIVWCTLAVSVLATPLAAAQTARPPEDLAYVRLAAQQGDADARFRLGQAYFNGEGVAQDDEEAIGWFLLAADQGHALAQHHLGLAHANGTGVDEDDLEAMRWFRLAAEQGYAVSQHNVAIGYANGLGVAQDLTEAIRWFRAAAEQGYLVAQYNLAIGYANGLGVEQDVVDAARWYRVAAEGGHGAAVTDLAALEATMTSDQVAEADRRARDWVARSQRPVVWVLATGGTISGGGGTPTSLTEYRSGTFSGAELVAAVPALADHAEIRVEQVANIGSPNITFDIWLTLARRIDEIFGEDPDVAGVVVTHGTSTLEETAYFLNLTVRHDRPVVLVGAQRPATAISSDGPLNLLNAVRTAAAPEARGKGVLVVMNDEINAARDVTKTSTYRVETFNSRTLGYLGYVDADRVSFHRETTKRHTVESEFDLDGVTALPRVDIVYSYVEPNPVVIRALLDDGVDGIVLAGTGAGVVSSAERDALADARALPPGSRPVIVRSSRTGSGRVVPLASYDDLDMVAADTLNPQKARVLLMLALMRTRDLVEIRRIFTEY